MRMKSSKLDLNIVFWMKAIFDYVLKTKSFLLKLSLLMGISFQSSVSLSEDDLHLDTSENLVLAETNSIRVSRKRDSTQRVSLEFEQLIPKVPDKTNGGKIEARVATIYRPPTVSSQLVTVELKKFSGRNYLVTIWQDGVNTSCLRIFDLERISEPFIWQKSSVGDVLYDVLDDGLEVKYNVRIAEAIDPVMQTAKWVPKTSSGD